MVISFVRHPSYKKPAPIFHLYMALSLHTADSFREITAVTKQFFALSSTNSISSPNFGSRRA
jgi:hypothetical protein